MITINSYEDYRKYMKAFKLKKLNLLTVVSRGGLGKTYMAEKELEDEAPLVFTGHVTPMSMYKAIYDRSRQEQDFIVIFDDVDSLMLNKTNVALLKQLCDTRETKTLAYYSSVAMLGSTPNNFETRCKVLMLMNDLNPADPNMKALMTRSHLVNFTPPDVEVLANMRTFGKDKEIFDFIGIYAPFSEALNLRCYKRAVELKDSGLDWKASIIDDLKIDPQLLEIYKLMKAYKTDKERVSHFTDSRPTYFRKKKFLLSKNPHLSNK